MAKKSRQIIPFFQLRHESEDTLQALADEIIRVISTIESAVHVDVGMNPGIKRSLTERADALRKLCISED